MVWRASAVLVLLLAGCTSGTGEPDVVKFSDGSQVELDDDKPTAGKGSLLGVVVDETIRPVVGAEVQVTGSDAVARTDSTGVFLVSDLDPGTYFFRVAAIGFVSTQASADVAPGETTRIKLQLQFDRTPQPSHETLHFQGFMQAWVTIGQFYTVGDENDTACSCMFHFTPGTNVSTFVYEVLWDPVAPDPGGLGEYYPELYQVDRQGIDFNGYCTSPCRFLIPAGSYVQGAELVARFTGPDFWVAVQQDFEVFLTIFYNGEAPEDWSFLEGS